MEDENVCEMCGVTNDNGDFYCDDCLAELEDSEDFDLDWNP